MSDQPDFSDPRRVPKLYEVRPMIREYLYGEVERLMKENGVGSALDDAVICSSSIRRLRSLSRINICEEPTIQPDSHSRAYDIAAARLTPAGAKLVGEIHRRCIPDGRILRD